MLAKWARRIARALLQAGLAGVRHWPVSDEKISFEYKVKRLLEGSLLEPSHAHVYWNGPFSDGEKQSLIRQPLPSAFHHLLNEVDELPNTSDALAHFLGFDQKYYLADDILLKSDPITMPISVEVRPPSLHQLTVDLPPNLPPHPPL